MKKLLITTALVCSFAGSFAFSTLVTGRDLIPPQKAERTDGAAHKDEDGNY